MSNETQPHFSPINNGANVIQIPGSIIILALVAFVFIVTGLAFWYFITYGDH